MRSIILLSKQSEIEKFKRILQDVFIVAYTEIQRSEFFKSFKNINTEVNNQEIDKKYAKSILNNIEIELENFSTENWKFDLDKCEDVFDLIVGVFVSAKNITKKEQNPVGSRNTFFNETLCKN